jgi:crotonobetainyl-CoA:carnitine CoA-transferase CaiB-like acyl-CoA transferase
MLLSDLGADVIKVESLSRPDSWRGAGTARRLGDGSPSASHWTTRPANPFAHPLNTSGSFNAVNRGKRSVNLDLTTAEGKAAFLDLVETADVVMENFTPRVMSNFGLSFESLLERNPRLVMSSFSGYGASGPYRDFRANGATTDATCGWAYLTGYEDGPPTMMGAMEADPITGLQLAASVLLSLEARAQSGGAQFCEGSMIETGVSLMPEEIMLSALRSEAPSRAGNRDRAMSPQGVFRCSGADQWIAISIRDDVDWASFASLAGKAEPLLTDPKFQHSGRRRLRQAEIERAIERWTSNQDARRLMSTLQGEGIPAGVVQSYSQVLEDPHLRERAWFRRLVHPDMGAHRYNGFPWCFSRTPARVRSAPPRQGEHSVEVLTGVLGYPAERVRDLISRRITGSILVAEQPHDNDN